MSAARLIAAAVIAALACTAIPPAAASDDTLTATGHWQLGVLGGARTNIQFECHATAPGAVGVGIGQCVLVVNGSTAATAPGLTVVGPAVATAGTAEVSFFGLRSVAVCWQADALYPNGHVATDSGCTDETLL